MAAAAVCCVASLVVSQEFAFVSPERSFRPCRMSPLGPLSGRDEEKVEGERRDVFESPNRSEERQKVVGVGLLGGQAGVVCKGRLSSLTEINRTGGVLCCLPRPTTGRFPTPNLKKSLKTATGEEAA